MLPCRRPDARLLEMEDATWDYGVTMVRRLVSVISEMQSCLAIRSRPTPRCCSTFAYASACRLALAG